jgi:hypothetical protein
MKNLTKFAIPLLLIGALIIYFLPKTEMESETVTETPPTSSTPTVANNIQLDHVIWAVPDLEEGAAFFKKLSGVEPIYGGAHPGRGTRNNLAAAGKNIYFEIIAPDPAQAPYDPKKEPYKAFANTIEKLENPEVDMFVFSSDNLEELARKGKELGLEVVGPKKGSRKMTDGFLLEWTHVDFIGHDFGQFVPFAINWGTMPHPSTTSPKGATIEGITVHHPRDQELRKIYETLGVPAKVVHGDTPQIIVHMKSEQGTFEVKSGPGLLNYYAARNSANI